MPHYVCHVRLKGELYETGADFYQGDVPKAGDATRGNRLSTRPPIPNVFFRKNDFRMRSHCKSVSRIIQPYSASTAADNFEIGSIQ
jgi:hypothetical protein